MHAYDGTRSRSQDQLVVGKFKVAALLLMIAHQQRLLLAIDFQNFVHRLSLHAVSLPHARRISDEQLLAALHLAAD